MPVSDGRPLLVGELNLHSTDPRYALWPEPAGCAGDRLCRLVMGLTPDDYLDRFARVNLCRGKWRTDVARAIAREISEGNPGRKVVLLGAKVAAAFGLLFDPFTVKTQVRLGPVAILPHPSGRCRAWNEPGAHERARGVLREYGVL